VKIKLSQWAKQNSLTYRTAHKYFKAGKLPAIQLESGTILVDLPEEVNKNLGKTVIYCRESSAENKPALFNQVERCVNFCNAKGWTVDKVVKEIGSGLNDKRPYFLKILTDKTISRIVVEHSDRFCRFGIEPIKELLASQNRELFIINNLQDQKEDLIQDFVSLVTSFCARIYGQRRTKRATEKLIRELQQDEELSNETR
jgi:predicted site-specific integrase-resolvase